MAEKIIQKDCGEGFEEDNKRYALYVLHRRVTASAMDGLKPIHRRLLYTTYAIEHAVTKTVKSSAIVGSCMKHFHPHGDAAVYGAMKPLTNWFEISLPLLSGDQGNWGTIQGDDASQPRYTENSISQFANECLFSDLKESKNVIDYLEAYNGNEYEPEYLPAKVPLLLINGTYGIGVGLKVFIPKHNIGDVVDATIKLMKNPNAKIVLVPDQCQNCDIVEANWKSISNKGEGRFIVRGRIETGEFKKHPALFIKSTPDLCFLNKILEKIHKLIDAKKLPQINNIFDETSEKDLELNCIIQLKKGSDPNYVRDIIYKNTDMQKTFSVNFEALDRFKPMRFSYKSYLQYFIEFRRITKFRLYCNKIQNISTRLHQVDLFIKIIQSGKINQVSKAISEYNGTDDNYLIEYFVKLLDITDLQAKFIINMNLKRLSKGYLKLYIKESKELHQEYDEYITKITNDELIDKEIIEELKYFKKKYGSPRKSRIISEATLNDIPEGEFKLVITEKNFIKKISLNDSIGRLKDDSPKLVIKVDNTKAILLFDEKGKVFKLDVHRVPISDKNSNGIDIRQILKNATSNINTVMYEPNLEKIANKTKKCFITVITSLGLIKKMDIEDFLTVPQSGIFYIKMDDNDIVKSVNIVPDTLDVIVYSDNHALRMRSKDIPHLRRNAKGNNAMSTKDLLDGLAIVKKDTSHIVVITNKGYINKMSIVALPCLGRFKNPSQIIQLKKGDSIKEILTTNENEYISIITNNNKYEFSVAELEEGSSRGSGKKLISTKINPIVKCLKISKK